MQRARASPNPNPRRPWSAQGTALYLCVLEALLRAEEARTGRAAFPALLASASFRKCLLACSFELVVASYCMVRAPRLDATSSWVCHRGLAPPS